jgi:hypothetical protein
VQARAQLGKKLLRPPTLGPNGGKLCRYVRCHNEVPKGRRTWCSDECVHQYRLRSHWSYARSHLRGREKGICQFCATDTRKLKSALMKPWKGAVKLCRQRGWEKNLHRHKEFALLAGEYARVAADLSAKGFHGFAPELPKHWRPRKHWKEPSDLWQADHIVPVSLGGDHEPSNLRTLCQPCHKTITKTLAVSKKLSEQSASG